MTNEPIGHDIDGRPLRVGDEVVVAKSAVNSNVGKRGKVIRYIGHVSGFRPDNRVEITAVLDTKNGERCNHHPLESLRKLHNDHRPADESFTEMMDKLKGEVV